MGKWVAAGGLKRRPGLKGREDKNGRGCAPTFAAVCLRISWGVERRSLERVRAVERPQYVVRGTPTFARRVLSDRVVGLRRSGHVAAKVGPSVARCDSCLSHLQSVAYSGTPGNASFEVIMNSVDENLNNTNPERALPASSLAAIEHTIRTHSRISRQVLTPNGAIGINLVATFILLMGGITATYMTWVLYRAKDGSIATADLNFLPIAGLISFGCVAVGTRLLFRYPRWSLPFADFQSWRITCGPLPTLFYLVGAYQAYVCVRRIEL